MSFPRAALVSAQHAGVGYGISVPPKTSTQVVPAPSLARKGTYGS